MKKSLIIIYISLLYICLSACSKNFLPERKEIKDLMMVQVLGIDKCQENPEDICITLLTKKTDGQSAGSSQNIILSNSAATFLESEREFQRYSDKRMFWGHVDYFLIGEEAAKEGIYKYINFIIRDNDIRTTAKIYIVKGTSAKEFIKVSCQDNFFLADRLDGIGKDSKLFAGSQDLKLQEFIQWLNKEHISAICPALQLEERESFDDPQQNQNQQKQQTKLDIDLGGYAIFENFKLVDIIDKELVWGENFLLNRISTGAIVVKDLNGDTVALDINTCNTKIKAEFKNKELVGMRIHVMLSTNINENHSMKLDYDETVFEHLEHEQNNWVEEHILNVINHAKENNTDFVDLGDTISVKNPVMWKKYKDKWKDIFPNIPVNVTVESKINRSYDMREPNGIYKGEHK